MVVVLLLFFQLVALVCSSLLRGTIPYKALCCAKLRGCWNQQDWMDLKKL